MTEQYSGWLFTGITLGLAAGLTPGPLLALVLSETLKHGKKHGLLVALVPLLTDMPILISSLFMLSALAFSNTALGIISLTGAVFIGYQATLNINTRGFEADKAASAAPDSLKKGVIANFLSPHPYLFWATVGAPLTLKAYSLSGLVGSALFVGGFYAAITGSKATAAILTDSASGFLRGKAYALVIRALGLVLFFFALMFLKEGLSLLGF